MTESEINQLKQEWKHLDTKEGFENYFWQINLRCKTQEEAYKIANGFYFGIFAKNRYANFESFRQSRDFPNRVKTEKPKEEKPKPKRQYKKKSPPKLV